MTYPKHRNTPDKYVIEPELIWALYWGEDLSCAEIAKLFGCTGSNIAKRMKKYDIPTRDLFSNHTKVKITKEELEDLYYKKELILEEIAEIYDCDPVTILFYMERYGLKRRPNKFEKGHKSWNEGTKGVMKANSASFKKGIIPWNKGIKWERMSGENNPWWKGGITPLNTILRTSAELRNWRREVFKRDDYTCQYCHEKSEKGHSIILNAHHIKSWADFPKERYNLENGIALCYDCHKYVHRIDILSQQ